MFPILYHAHHSMHQEDLPFWLKLAQSFPAPVLELGCGTGRVLIPLLQAGHQAVGLDRDMGMLKLLKTALSHFPAVGNRIFQADFTAFNLDLRFGLIILTCNTYSTLDRVQRSRLLERVKAHLRPDGIFAASMPNPALLQSMPRRSSPEVEDVFPHPLDGEPVQVSSEWRRDAETFRLTWHYDHLLPHGKVDRLSVDVVHHLTAFEEHLSEIRSTGLNPFELLGEYDGSDYSSDSTQLIMLISQVK